MGEGRGEILVPRLWPGNRCPEALPRVAKNKLEAEPPDLRYQALPGNE